MMHELVCMMLHQPFTFILNKMKNVVFKCYTKSYISEIKLPDDRRATIEKLKKNEMDEEK